MTWKDVKNVARLLEEAGVEYALVGGYALCAHGYGRFTEYTDILANPSAANSKRWSVALSMLPDAAAAELAPEHDVFAADDRYAIRINDEFTVDVMPSIAGISWGEIKSHVTSTKIDDFIVKLLDLRGLHRQHLAAVEPLAMRHDRPRIAQ